MRVLLPVLVVVGVGCVPPPPVYRVQRAARVPRPAAPLRTGEPLAGPVGISFEATAGDTAELANEKKALEVPSQQVRGELRVRIGRGEIAPFYEQSIESSYGQLDPTQASVGEGTAVGYGLATRYSIATPSPHVSIGTALEMMSFSMPVIEYRTCVENCEVNNVYGTEVHEGTESTGSFGLGITPTYRSGPVAFYGGMYMRRHPTIERKGTEIGGEYDEDISGGSYNVLLHAGVEYRTSAVSFGASIQQNIASDPVNYGPSVGFSIALHVPDSFRLPRPRPPEPSPRRSHWVVEEEPAPKPHWLVEATASSKPAIDDDELPDDPWP